MLQKSPKTGHSQRRKVLRFWDTSENKNSSEYVQVYIVQLYNSDARYIVEKLK